MEIECRDVVKRGYIKNEKGTTCRNGYVESPLVSVNVGYTLLLVKVDHVRVEGVWFMRVPESEQQRLSSEWEKRV